MTKMITEMMEPIYEDQIFFFIFIKKKFLKVLWMLSDDLRSYKRWSLPFEALAEKQQQKFNIFTDNLYNPPP